MKRREFIALLGDPMISRRAFLGTLTGDAET